MSKKRLAVISFGLALCASAAPAMAGDGTNLYPLLSADTQMVMVFDVADSRDSKLLMTGFEKLLAAKPEAKAKMVEIGIDPMKDVDTVVFAGGGVSDFEDLDAVKSMTIVIEGRLPKDKLSTIPDAKKSTYKTIDIYTAKDTDAAFVGDRLFFTKKGQMKAQIDLAQGKAKAKSIAGSSKAKKLRAALATTDTTADLWIAVLVPEKNKKDMGGAGIVANSVSGGMNFSANLAMAVRVDSNSEDGAKKMVSMIQTQLAQVTGTLGQIGLTKAAKSITVVQDKAAIKLGITLTEAEINSLIAMAGMFAGGGGGAQPPPPPPPVKSSTAPAPAPAKVTK